MGVVFTFPGQGAQRPGMLAALPDSTPVRQTLDEAAETLGRRTDTLDTKDAQADTRTVQLVLSIAGVAAARHLIAAAARPDAVMGMSVGAWPAAVIAGVLDYADALTLVAARGRLMAAAYPKGYGMSAVVGLDQARVARLVEQYTRDDAPLYIGNVNSDQQIVVAGSDAALDRLAAAAERAGAARVQRLDMAVPSHCPLLDDAAGQLAKRADPDRFSAPGAAYFSANARRRLARADAVREDLVYNMARPVYWAASARIVHESGYELAVEMPPARVLTDLYPAMDGPGEAIAVVDTGWHNSAALIRRAAADRG